MPFLNSKLMWSHTMEAACEAPILRIPQKLSCLKVNLLYVSIFSENAQHI